MTKSCAGAGLLEEASAVDLRPAPRVTCTHEVCGPAPSAKDLCRSSRVEHAPRDPAGRVVRARRRQRERSDQRHRCHPGFPVPLLGGPDRRGLPGRGRPGRRREGLHHRRHLPPRLPLPGRAPAQDPDPRLLVRSDGRRSGLPKLRAVRGHGRFHRGRQVGVDERRRALADLPTGGGGYHLVAFGTGLVRDRFLFQPTDKVPRFGGLGRCQPRHEAGCHLLLDVHAEHTGAARCRGSWRGSNSQPGRPRG